MTFDHLLALYFITFKLAGPEAAIAFALKIFYITELQFSKAQAVIDFRYKLENKEN